MEDRKAQALRAERERKIRPQEDMAQALRQPQSSVPGELAEFLDVD